MPTGRSSSFFANSIHWSTRPASKKVAPYMLVSARRRATYLAIAAASQMQPDGVSSTGTLPIGDLARKAAVLLSLPISKGGTAISTPLYLAMIRLCSACTLPAYV